jgi:hypothetical protein
MTTSTIGTITRENKKLLKNADTISFRMKDDGTSQIECCKKIKIDGFETEVREIIPVGTTATIYDGYGKGISYEITKAFYWLSYSKNDLVWQTVVKSLKINDGIILEWIAGNNSNLLNDNNLSNDQLNLKIKRNGKIEMIFHIGQEISHKHSSARMIKIREKY